MGSPGCGEWGFLCWALGQGTEGPPHGPSVDCPWGPGLGGTALEVSKWHPPRCRRVGREGAGRGGGWAPGLFCVGRLPLPVSAGWHGQQSVGVGTVQGPWLLPAGPGKGLPWGCLPRARPGLDQPLPWPTAVTVAAGEMRLSHGTRGQGLPAYVPTPDHQSCSWDPTLGFGPGNPPPTGLAATRGAGPVQHLSDWGIHLNTLPRWHLLPMLSGLPGFGQAGWWLGWGEWGPHGRSCGVCGGLRPCRGPPAGAGGLDLPGCLGRAPGWPSLWIQVQGGGRSAAGADPEGWAPVPHSGKDSVQATGLRWAVASLRPSQNHARCPTRLLAVLGCPAAGGPVAVTRGEANVVLTGERAFSGSLVRELQC